MKGKMKIKRLTICAVILLTGALSGVSLAKVFIATQLPEDAIESVEIVEEKPAPTCWADAASLYGFLPGYHFDGVSCNMEPNLPDHPECSFGYIYDDRPGSQACRAPREPQVACPTEGTEWECAIS